VKINSTILEAEPDCIKLLAPNGNLLNKRCRFKMIEADSLEQALSLFA
jgi:hypothetical protein